MDHRLQQHTRPLGVDGRVLVDLVHALADPHPSGEVHHVIDSAQRAPNRRWIAHVGADELDLVLEIGRPLAGAVDLRLEVVERPHLVSETQQMPGQMRSDEPGPTSDQHSLGQLRSLLPLRHSPPGGAFSAASSSSATAGTTTLSGSGSGDV